MGFCEHRIDTAMCSHNVVLPGFIYGRSIWGTQFSHSYRPRRAQMVDRGRVVRLCLLSCGKFVNGQPAAGGHLSLPGGVLFVVGLLSSVAY